MQTIIHRNAFIFVLCIYRSTPKEITACSNKGGEGEIPAKLVNIVQGTIIRLLCDFCQAEQNFYHETKHETTNWFYRKRGSPPTWSKITDEQTKNPRLTVLSSLSNLTNTLVINGFHVNDSGIYACNTMQNYNNLTFTYVLDGIFETKIKAKRGSVDQLLDIEKKFAHSINEQAQKYQMSCKVTFVVNIAWERWGPCESIGHYKGIRKKLGRCELKPKSVPKFETLSSEDKIALYYLKDCFEISCYSIKLNETFSELSRLVRRIPNFEASETCTPDLAHTNFSTQSEDLDQVHKIDLQIAENGHCTLACADCAFGSKINWYKDKMLLNSSYRNNMADKKEPHITIDPFDTLYILHATKNEEGYYICTVDNAKAREYFIKVVSMAKMLNQDFIRYSIYLGFVLSLTFTCYCAGLCVAWHRRASFADPLNLNYGKKFRDAGDNNSERETLIKK